MPDFQIEIIPVTPLQQNTSLIISPTSKKAVFVDPGGEADKLMAAAEKHGVQIEAIWLTHGHLDHAGAATEIAERTGCPIIGPHKDDQWLLDEVESFGRQYGIADGRNVTPDAYLNDGDTLTFDGQIFGVVHCPGHTPGHVVIYQNTAKIAFVGDVIFKGSIGRTDFPKGNHQDLLDSIAEKLWPLGDDMQFIPGHGPMSTFGEERKTNPFVADSVLGNG